MLFVRSFRRVWGILAVVCAVALAPAVTQAGYTTIKPPYASPKEASHEAIFEHLYGGDFSPVGGVHFTNGTVYVERIDDDFDQVYDTGTFDFIAEAVFATFDQSFGYLPGSSGGSYIDLMPVTGLYYDADGQSAGVQLEGPFRWARNGFAGVRSSQSSDNYAGMDHVITYEVRTAQVVYAEDTQSQVVVPVHRTFLLFFEDNSDQYGISDWDYNDLVVRVSQVGEIQPPAPEPGTLGLAAVTGAALLLRRRRA